MKDYLKLISIIILLSLLLGYNACSDPFIEISKSPDYFEGYYRGYFNGFKEGQDRISDWKVFTDDQIYCVLLPPDWVVTKDQTLNYIISSPHDSAYVSLGIETHYSRIDECIDAEVIYMQDSEFHSNFKLLSDKKVIHHGFPARLIEYTWNSSLNQIPERYRKSLALNVGGDIHKISFFVNQNQIGDNINIIDMVFSTYHPLGYLSSPE